MKGLRFLYKSSTILTIFLLLAFSFPAISQPWLKKLTDPEINGKKEKEFIEIKKAFREYWENREIKKGKGYKPFSRWEWMMEARTGTGIAINKSVTLWNAYLQKIMGDVTEGNWYQFGPKIPPTDISTGIVVGAGRIDCIAFHPADPLIYYIGSPTGGLWKTVDGGNSWVTLTDHIPSLGIADIAIHPNNFDLVFIATGDRDAGEIYSAGVLKSIDAGITWDTTSLSFTQDQEYVVNRLLIKPDNPDTMIAATNNGIYLMTEGGSGSEMVQSGHFKDLEFKPSEPNVIYAASYSYGYSSVFKSTDGGVTFSESFGDVETINIRRIELAVTPSEPDWIYALCADKNSSGFLELYRSTDSGESWERYATTSKNLLGNEHDGSDDGGQGWYDLSLAVSPVNGNEVYVGGINIWKTLIGGDSWDLVSFGFPEWEVTDAPYVHVDHHILKYHPLTRELYSGNDGGIYKTNDHGQSWTDLSSGLEILQIYRIGLSATKSDLFMMGSQDNSTIRYKDSVYKVVIGGDGMECIVDYSDTNVMYASSQRGNLRISRDGGKNFYNIIPDSEDEGAWVTPYVLHPTKPKTLYAGYSELYMSRNQGGIWTKLTSRLTAGKKFTSIAVASSNTFTIYAATKSRIWRTANQGESWDNISNGLPDGGISYIAVSQYDQRKIWVALSNYTQNEKVYTSEDGGTTWFNFSEGLPNIPANCLVFENNGNSGLYVGTDLGVYYRNKEMDSWINFSKGLPNVIVNELEIYYPDDKLRAGTYGRGLWESDLYKTATSPLFAEFSVNKNDVCLDGQVILVNHSSASADSIQWMLNSDATASFSEEKDTVTVHYSKEGKKDITLIAFRNGESDTLTRNNFISVNTAIDISLHPNTVDYFWRGDTLVIEAYGGSNYEWSPDKWLDTTIGPTVFTSPDSTITYYVTASEGQCTDIDSVLIEVYQNDLIKFAIPLNVGENGPFININASVEVNEPHPPLEDCNTQTDWCDEFGNGEGVLGNTVWFSFQGPSHGIVSIDSRGFDNQIAVYKALHPDSILAGNYSILAANDDYHNEELFYAAALVNIEDLVEGETYWVQMDGSGGNKVGEFYLYFYEYPLSISEINIFSENDHFIIFPNPNDGTFTIKINPSVYGNAHLKIFSLTGKLIHTEKFYLTGDDQEFQISLNHNASGLYLVQIISGNWTEIKKFYVE